MYFGVVFHELRAEFLDSGGGFVGFSLIFAVGAPESPNSRSQLGARRKRTGVVCVVHRHMIQDVELKENLPQLAVSKLGG